MYRLYPADHVHYKFFSVFFDRELNKVLFKFIDSFLRRLVAKGSLLMQNIFIYDKKVLLVEVEHNLFHFARS